MLPPGWVALGFLLLLGCQALQPWAGQLKQWNVMQVTMFPLKADTSASYLSFLKEHPEHNARNEFNPYVTPLQAVAANTLQKMRPWHNAEFSGNRLADFLSAATTESAIRKIIADTSHAGGVRIRFLPGATYANLVKVLDIMNYTNQKKYFLDIHHKPTTLYAITDEPLPVNSTPLFVCDFVNTHPIPAKHTLQQLIVQFGQQISLLGNQVWRFPILLLVLIGSLNLWRLFYASLNRRNS
ncbi:hypothetical protein A0257_20845 [Hymenobacter psoromatis]|nr:hypothetical protein A0257_20845 [Hymenobacter psoromatis]